MSNLLFARSYLLIILLILAAGWGLDRLLADYTEQATISTEKTLLRGSFLYIDTRLTQHRQAIPIAWARNQAAIETTLGYPAMLYQLSDFSAADEFVHSLAAGQIIALSSESNAILYYRQMSNSDYIIALGPLHSHSETPISDILLIAIYHLLVAGALFLWLRPVSSALHELRTAAVNFGEENFAARVNLTQTSAVRPVADAFNAMAQRIEDLISAHEALTHAVSHELKTPLSRFKFSLEIMGNVDDVLQRQQYLQAMKEDVRELDELIEEMLSYARFGAHNLELNLETINAQHWLQAIIQQYDSDPVKTDLHQVAQILDTEKNIRIDTHLMSRAINNLIRNGLRYAQSQLTVSLDMTDQPVIIRIDDDGPGIPESYREQVFQPFTRIDTSRDRQSGGYGLGLAITQKIVQQHGGHISVDQSPLGGAGFILCLPLRTV